MPLLPRRLAILALALAPTGCDWCRAPDFHELRAWGTVRDASGATLGQAQVTLDWIGDDVDDGLVGIGMVGPPELADSARAGWAAGGPLQGWTATVRVEDASGNVLVEVRPQRGSRHEVFYTTGAKVEDARFDAMRSALRSGRAMIVIETIDDPRVPLPGPVRATLPEVSSSRSEGACT